MALSKITISLTERQLTYLRQEAERLGVAVSDIIRRIIDQQMEAKR